MASVICLEGYEGVGKSTLARWVSRIHHRRYVRLPGGSPPAEAIRKALRAPGLSAMAQAQMHAAAQWATLDLTISPLIEAGTPIVLDRSNLSPLAYQGGGNGLEPELLNTLYPRIPTSAYILLHHRDFEEAWRNFAQLRDLSDPVEARERSFHERVHAAYGGLADEAREVGTVGGVPTLVVDLPMGEVRVREVVSDWLSGLGLLPPVSPMALR